jgi:hypothetical protein
MNRKTRYALEGSIQKWEGIVAGTEGDRGTNNCPLCTLFYVGLDHACEGCPVRKKTGQAYCNGSPYRKFIDAADRVHFLDFKAGVYADTPELQKAAKAELRFLKGLLPKKKKKKR